MSQRASVTAVPQVPASHQLQYLEAMGITAWTARYRIPNAAETPACDWPEVAAAPAVEPPVQRLHSLLDEAPAVAVSTPKAIPKAPSLSSSPGRMRALLDAATGEQVLTAEAGLSTPVSSPASSALSTSSSSSNVAPVQAAVVQQALRFTLQVAALDDCWLVVLVQPKPPTPSEQRLLSALWASVGIHADHTSPYIDFQWPMIEGLMVESPLIEAQQGIKAFLEGRARSGLKPQQLVLFGTDDNDSMTALRDVLALDNASHSTLLALPVWQGPALSTLMASGQAKAALWPQLKALGQQWLAMRNARAPEEAK